MKPVAHLLRRFPFPSLSSSFSSYSLSPENTQSISGTSLSSLFGEKKNHLLSPPPCSPRRSNTQVTSSPSISLNTAQVSSPAPPSSSSLSLDNTQLTSTPSLSSNKTHLTEEELERVNQLIPLLCHENHLLEAIKLVEACFMANSSIESLSTIQSLVQRLCEEPNLAQTMALITKLKHIRCLKKDDFLSLNKLLIVEYFGRRRFKEGMKLFGRLCGEDSKWAPDYSLCEEVIKGCYRWPMGFEALRVVRFMVGNSAIPGPDSWGLVLRCLLREARVREAQELNEAFVGCVHKEGGTLVNGLEKLAKVIDRVLNDWEN